MADISASIKPSRGVSTERSGDVYTKSYFVDIAASALTPVATHNLITIPTGTAVVGGYVCIEASCTGTTGFKLQFKIGTTGLTGAIPEASLVIGSVIGLWGGITAVTSFLGYAQSADDTLDLAVSAQPAATGKMLITLLLIDVATAIAQGTE